MNTDGIRFCEKQKNKKKFLHLLPHSWLAAKDCRSCRQGLQAEADAQVVVDDDRPSEGGRIWLVLQLRQDPQEVPRRHARSRLVEDVGLSHRYQGSQALPH
jgi:hypothetical protein